MGRTAKIERKTKETDIRIALNLDGTGQAEIETGMPFFNHMLDVFSRHGLFDVKIRAKGDIEVDYHHTVEDVGLRSVRRSKRRWETNRAFAALAKPAARWMKRWPKWSSI